VNQCQYCLAGKRRNALLLIGRERRIRYFYLPVDGLPQKSTIAHHHVITHNKIANPGRIETDNWVVISIDIQYLLTVRMQESFVRSVRVNGMGMSFIGRGKSLINKRKSSAVLTCQRFNLTGLPNNTTFEWQIRSTCSASSTSDHLPGTNFSTQCRAPINTNTNLITVSSARLDWTPAGAGIRYDVRYRRTGNPEWTQITDIGGSPTLLGIASGASYEWQVRTHCNDGQYSDYSALITFSSFQCTAPDSFGYSTLTESTATIGWTYSISSTDTRMEIRYRPVGTADWITATNIVYSNSSGSYSLTGLIGSTQY
jgi:hypothetical protein